MDELLVTLDMLDVQYNICYNHDILIDCRVINEEVKLSITSYLDLYNFNYTIGFFDNFNNDVSVSGITFYILKGSGVSG